MCMLVAILLSLNLIREVGSPQGSALPISQGKNYEWDQPTAMAHIGTRLLGGGFRQALTRVRFYTRRSDSHVDDSLWQESARSTKCSVAGHQVRQQSLMTRSQLKTPALVSGSLFVVLYGISPWDLLTLGLSILSTIPCLQMWSFPPGLQRTCKSCTIQTTSGITCQIRCRTRLSSSRAPIRKRRGRVVSLHAI